MQASLWRRLKNSFDLFKLLWYEKIFVISFNLLIVISDFLNVLKVNYLNKKTEDNFCLYIKYCLIIWLAAIYI